MGEQYSKPEPPEVGQPEFYQYSLMLSFCMLTCELEAFCSGCRRGKWAAPFQTAGVKIHILESFPIQNNSNDYYY